MSEKEKRKDITAQNSDALSIILIICRIDKAWLQFLHG